MSRGVERRMWARREESGAAGRGIWPRRMLQEMGERRDRRVLEVWKVG